MKKSELISLIQEAYQEVISESNKKWYRISPKVEYSTDFNFFLKNQILFSKSELNDSGAFSSRLDGTKFGVKTNIYKDGSLTQDDIKAFARKIHTDILAGKYGKGELVESASLKSKKILKEELDYFGNEKDMEVFYKIKTEKKNLVKEGVWGKPTQQGKKDAISSLQAWQNKYYGIVGSDAVWNGIDATISEIESLSVIK